MAMALGPIGPARMTISEHFAELRRRLLIVTVCVLVATIAIYNYSDELIEFLVVPIASYLPGGESLQQLNIFSPMGGFTLRFKVSFVAAIMVTAPIWIWHLLAFFVPALKENERKWVLPTFFIAVALFIIGNIFCYCIILAPAFEWMIDQTSGFANVFPDAYEYVNMVLGFEFAFGIAFELPVIVFYLVVFNVVPYKKLRSSWRVVYVVTMVACAFITPDGSPVSMLMLFGAMIGLYEASLAFARIALRKRIAKQQAEAAAEETELAQVS